jgi:transposase
MVSNGVVTRLLQQKRTKGDLSPKAAPGGKPSQLAPYQAEIIDVVNHHPDLLLLCLFVVQTAVFQSAFKILPYPLDMQTAV